jgi:hypothetical protein
MLPSQFVQKIFASKYKMQQQNTKKQDGWFSYAFSVIKYYFLPHPRSVLTILYFLFFSYFVVFYLSRIFLVVRFMFNTLVSSTIALSAKDMLWGAVFIVILAIPFLASIVILILPYEMRKRAWPRTTRVVLVSLFAIVIIIPILFADFSTGFVERQAPIKTFMEEKGIPLSP